jgi:glycosyltransferase involved in cell wall biosynthesis
MRILFLGETYRADAQTWIKGIEGVSHVTLVSKEIKNSGGRVSRIFAAIRFLGQLAFDSESYDITLAERATSYGFFSLLVKTRVRIVAQQGITDAFPEEGFAGWYKRILQKSIYTRADLIHAWGYVMTYAMLETGAPPSKILVKPKGLDLTKYRFPAEKPSGVLTAIVTRSLFPIYRHGEILEAIAILKSQGIHINCLMVGSGVLEESLKNKTKQLNLEDQVTWLGRIDNSLLPEYLMRAHIYLAVPETEGVSASLFEAMACGCFPIVTDLNSNRAFINSGENGMLVPVGRPDLLAESIEKFAIQTSEFQNGILSNRKFIEKNCDLKINMADFFDRYQKLLNHKK